MGKKNRHTKKHVGKRTVAQRVRVQSAVSPVLQIPRPRVTGHVGIAAVPHFIAGVPAGAVAGSYGDYEVTLVLGVPGISSVTTAMNVPELLRAGDSLLESDGLDIDLQGANGAGRLTATIVPNRHRRLARVNLTVLAKDFADAERMALDNMSATLSRIAFQADTALEVSAVVLVEKATKIVHASAILVGSVQSVPLTEVAGWSTEQLRPFLAAYREGLNNSSAPLYQALAFYKILEGAPAFHKNRARAAAKSGIAAPPDPFDAAIPTDPNELPADSPWDRDAFTPYLGMSFADVEDHVKTTIRNGVAHLSPGMDLRIADLTEDNRACSAIVPVLRYVARRIITGEFAYADATGARL